MCLFTFQIYKYCSVSTSRIILFCLLAGLWVTSIFSFIVHSRTWRQSRKSVWLTRIAAFVSLITPYLSSPAHLQVLVQLKLWHNFVSTTCFTVLSTYIRTPGLEKRNVCLARPKWSWPGCCQFSKTISQSICIATQLWRETIIVPFLEQESHHSWGIGNTLIVLPTQWFKPPHSSLFNFYKLIHR